MKCGISAFVLVLLFSTMACERSEFCSLSMCTIATEYCAELPGGLFGFPPSYQCQSIPEACRAETEATCDCMAGQEYDANIDECTVEESGLIVITHVEG